MEEVKQGATELILDYPGAARSIALWLSNYCDESLPYTNMIAEAAKRASEEIWNLKLELSDLKRKMEVINSMSSEIIPKASNETL